MPAFQRSRVVDSHDLTRGLSGIFDEHSESGLPWWRFCAANPRTALRMVSSITALPRLTVEVPGERSDPVFSTLSRRYGFLPRGLTGLAVLTIPRDPSEYTRGRRRQALRTNSNRAARRGVTTALVTDRAERNHLRELGEAAERSHAMSAYRNAAPRNDDLESLDFWLAGYSSEGAPLVLAVMSVCGEWALLRYFKTLGSGSEYSDAKYLVMVELVRRLAERGVVGVVDRAHPAAIQPGLRYFQSVTGFEYARLAARRVRRPGPEAVGRSG